MGEGRTWNVEAVERKRAAKVAHTNAPELTPDRIPNADARSLSDILSAYKQKIPELQHQLKV